jgi:hypothetical protein
LKSQTANIINYVTETGIDDSEENTRIITNKGISTKTIETNSPKNNFLGMGNHGKLN